MPRLKDLLEYLATPGLEDIWVLLDIKVPWPALTEPFKKDRVDHWRKLDNRADDVFRLIAATLAEVKPSRPWNERVLVGCWAVSFTFMSFGNLSLISRRLNTSLHARNIFQDTPSHISDSASLMLANSSRSLASRST